MPRLIIAFFCLAILLTKISAQDCSALVPVSKVIGGSTVVYSSKVLLVVRGNYSYSIEFSNDDKGIIARVTSIAGDEINQDDHVVFVNPLNEKRTFRFTGLGEVVKTGATTGRVNTLQLDLPAVEWLSTNDITGFYVINNVKHQLQRITLLPNRTQEFRLLSGCFLNAIDKSKIKDIKSSEIASVGAAANIPKTIAGGPTSSIVGTAQIKKTPEATPPTDQEIADLKKELADTKTRLRAEIQTEKEVMVEVHLIENHLVETQTELKEIVLLKEVQAVKENQVMQEELPLILNRNSKRKVGNKYD